ncbi:hypothetical protein KBZ15_15405 [Cyanobium sp. BA20m-p-22]|uniref:hypothetical protein n=1 Tax=Cyanobium sp. BA20m-p-22 TaxID=2823704 RepID=UPI0020CF8BA9|nr:hypothetical protein [Cyanobium sp. BA20m-p-22]MCP9911280.1 hypothetical protein [Cyanobium sp. BA20m-p-22]
MTFLEQQITEYLQQQETAKRVLLVIKKNRRKKGEAQEMPPIPSALLTAEETEELEEEHSFYVYRTDTNAVLARGIQGFEAAKERANQLRKSHGLKWDEVKFKSERGNQSSGGSGGAAAAPKKQFGVSRDGKTFTNTSGQSGRVDYAKRYNPSKGRRFSGYTDPQGNYHDIS